MRYFNHIVVFSGGMDSFTLLHKVMKENANPYQTPEQAALLTHKLRAISFDYGQRHRTEVLFAREICLRMNIPHEIIPLDVLKTLAKGSALTDDIAVPHGHYAAEQMRKTVVPGRNTVMLALALAYAEGLDPEADAMIYYGAHAGDHHIYPDCRPEFVEAMGDAIEHASDCRVQMMAPFMNMTKAQILTKGLALGIPLADYGQTRTCYEGGELACGLCGSCSERLESFELNGVVDPVVYAPLAETA